MASARRLYFARSTSSCLRPPAVRRYSRTERPVSDTGRSVREYRLTSGGRKQLEVERAKYRRLALAITTVLDTA